MTVLNEQLRRLVVQHATTNHLIGAVKEKKAQLWVEYLKKNDVELSAGMEKIARRQARAKNAAKPIGLFIGDDSLVAEQDSTLPAESPEKKRQSLIESWYFWGCQSWKYDQISRAAVIPGTAKILDASALPNPTGGKESLVQYVEVQIRKIS